MVYTQKKSIETEKNAIISINDAVIEAVRSSNIMNGIITVDVPHSTAGVIRATASPSSTKVDLAKEIKRLVPSRIDFAHNESADDAAGHIKSAIFGNSASAVIENGTQVAGSNLEFFFLEFDGPRCRDYYITIIGE